MCFAAGDAALQFQYCVARTVVHRVLCTSQENSRPKTFRKNAKKAKNAKKPYFYKVKRRKITHADAKKCEKWEQMLFVLLCIVFCAHPRKIPGRKLLGKMRKKRKMRKKTLFL